MFSQVSVHPQGRSTPAGTGLPPPSWDWSTAWDSRKKETDSCAQSHGDLVVNTFAAEKSRKMVLKILCVGINMHEIAKAMK